MAAFGCAGLLLDCLARQMSSIDDDGRVVAEACCFSSNRLFRAGSYTASGKRASASAILIIISQQQSSSTILFYFQFSKFSVSFPIKSSESIILKACLQHLPAFSFTFHWHGVDVCCECECVWVFQSSFLRTAAIEKVNFLQFFYSLFCATIVESMNMEWHFYVLNAFLFALTGKKKNRYRFFPSEWEYPYYPNCIKIEWSDFFRESPVI